MRSVFVMNNYPIDIAKKLVETAEYPGQHLWGMYELADQIEWHYSSSSLAKLTKGRPVMRRVASHLLPIIGDPLQAWDALRNWRHIDVIYAADQQSAIGLLFLKRLRFLAKPVVVVVHNGPRLKWSWFALRAATTIIVLSPATQALVTKMLPGAALQKLIWGPSLTSPLYKKFYSAAKDLDFIAAGKSNRDYAELRAIALEAGLTGRIYSGRRVEYFEEGSVSVRDDQPLRYDEILTQMARARWCVISVADKTRLSGLTEAADALAVGTRVLANSRIALPYDSGSVEFYESRQELTALLLREEAAIVDPVHLQHLSMMNFANGLMNALEDAL